MSLPTLTASFSDPLWSTSTWRTAFHFSSGYTHEIRRFGGYWSASLERPVPRPALDDWIERGLGRHCMVYDDALCPCWTGFVNQILVELEDEVIQIGPLLDTANRVAVRYAPLIPVTNPPVRLDPTLTAYGTDTASQAQWGIWSRIFDAGELTDAAALQVRDMRLAEWADPPTSRAVGATNPLTLRVDLLGYVHLLNAPYEQTVNSGEIDIANAGGTGKLQAILSAEPNGLLSTDWRGVTANTVQVEAYEEGGATGLDLLKGMVALGDAAYNPYQFGIYDEQRADYSAIPYTVTYQQAAGDPFRRIYTTNWQWVRPWNVRPARWLFYSSFVVGATIPTLDPSDPRYELMEWVRFTAPYDLQHEGGRAAIVDQVLAQRGLSGVYM